MSMTEIEIQQSDVDPELDDALVRRKLVNDFGPVSLYHMKVYLRIRPLKNDIQKCLSVVSSQSVVLTAPEQSMVFRNNSSNEEKIKQRYTFSHVFGPSDDQKKFFKGAVLGTVSDFVNGQNCLLFAYGATNSGKTYTVQGSATEPGLIPNALEVIFNSIGDRLDSNLNLRPVNSCNVEQLTPKHMAEVSGHKDSLLDGVHEFCSSQCSSNQSASLFDQSSKDGDESRLSIHERENFRFQIWVSFAEIYNENIFDLLDSCPEKRRRLRLAMDITSNSYIKDLKILPVNSPQEARQVLSLGRKNLRIASTKLNQTSSRSHCIFTIYLVKVVDSPDPQQAMINSLSFCDLAGSERVVKTQNTGDRLKEAGKINTSLMVFGRCIEALRVAQNSKERPVVPYRDSKLTQLFQFFFSGKGRASMIVNVSPSVEMYEDTVNVLKVSAIAKQVVSDQLEKTFLNLTCGSQRLTDLWIKSGERWSSFTRGKTLPSKMSIMTQREDSVIVEEDENNTDTNQTETEEQPDVQELIDLVIELEKKCNSLMDENEQLEVRLRKELADEFHTQFINMEKSYERRIQRAKDNADEYWEKRMEIAEKALTINARLQKETSQEDEGETDEDDDDSETEKLKEEITVLKSELSTSHGLLSKEREQLQTVITELQSKHEKKEQVLKENIQSLSQKITLAEQFLDEERSQFERKIKEDKERQVENAKKMKNLEEEMRSLISKVSENGLVTRNEQIVELQLKVKSLEVALEKKDQELKLAEAQVDKFKQKVTSLEKTLETTQRSLKTAEEQSNRAVQDIEKQGDMLFDKDAEINDLTIKVQNLEKEATRSQSLRLSLERHRLETQNLKLSEQKTKELLEKKESEINLLKAQIATVERINSSEDFQVPTTRGRRRRKAANENKAPSDDSSTSLVDSSYSSKSSMSLCSPKGNMKDENLAVLGLLDQIKQSPPVLAVRNAIGNLRESMRIKSSSDEAPITTGSVRKLRRKMYEKDNYEPLECTPPKQANTSQSVHTIVTRQLRNRK